MSSLYRENLRERAGPAVDPGNTGAPGLQNNQNGPPGPDGNKKGPPTAPLATTTEGPAISTSTSTSTSQTPPTATATSESTSKSALATASHSSSPSPITSLLNPSSTTSLVSVTTPTVEISPVVSSTSFALAPSIYYETAPTTSASTLSRTTLSTTFITTSSAAFRPTVLVPPPPNTVVQYRHGVLDPGQKAGIALGTIAGFALILALLFLFKWRKGEQRKALPRPRFFKNWGGLHWPLRSQSPAEMSDSLLTEEAGSRGSPGWDYTSTFAQPTVPKASRRSLSRSLRKLVRLNPLGQNPVTPGAPRGESSSRNSFSSFFRRRSTASTSPSFIDEESPPPLPALPAMFQSSVPPPSLRRESSQSDIADSLRPPTIPAEVLPPAFHRSWCYRNSQISLATENSDARSFQSVPGWVKFHYPRRSQNVRLPSHRSEPALIAPQALSPGSWLKAKILRRSRSTVASEEKGGSYTSGDAADCSASSESPVAGPSRRKQTLEEKEGVYSSSDCSDESESTESPVAGPSRWKQTPPDSSQRHESTISLALEKQDPWET